MRSADPAPAHCPRCGSRTVTFSPIGESSPRWLCTAGCKVPIDEQILGELRAIRALLEGCVNGGSPMRMSSHIVEGEAISPGAANAS